MHYFLLTITFVISLVFSHELPRSIGQQWHQPVRKDWDAKKHHQMRDQTCPDKTTIYPCTCTIDDDLLIFLDCTSVTTESQLCTIFEQNFPSPDMDYFFIGQNVNSEIIQLTDNVFDTKTFRRVRFADVNFNVSVDIFDNMTQTIERLEFLYIPFVNFTKNFTLFTKLDYFEIFYAPLEEFYITSPTLTGLEIGFTNLKERSDGFPYNLGHMENLETLYFYRNKVRQAPDTAGYQKLKSLSIDDSKISVLNTSNWATDSYLDICVAALNEIEDIDGKYLKVAANASLYFEINKLRHLEEEKWRHIFTNASYVSLYINPFECGCDIDWLFGNDPWGTPFMSKLQGKEECSNGKRFTELDPEEYATMCS